MIGIGNYVLGADEGTRQTAAAGGGGSSVITGLSQLATGLFPGGVPAAISAARGGAGGPAPAAAASGGGGFNLGSLVPFALIGVAVLGGYIVIKKLRKKA